MIHLPPHLDPSRPFCCHFSSSFYTPLLFFFSSWFSVFSSRNFCCFLLFFAAICCLFAVIRRLNPDCRVQLPESAWRRSGVRLAQTRGAFEIAMPVSLTCGDDNGGKRVATKRNDILNHKGAKLQSHDKIPARGRKGQDEAGARKRTRLARCK